MVDNIMAIQKCSNKSLELNAAVNTVIDLEKLTLSKARVTMFTLVNNPIVAPL